MLKQLSTLAAGLLVALSALAAPACQAAEAKVDRQIRKLVMRHFMVVEFIRGHGRSSCGCSG